MALLKDSTLESGIQVSQAYHRIDNVSGSKNLLFVQVNSYLSAEVFRNGKIALEVKHYSFTPSTADDAQNFIKQAYEHLKTLTDFESAIDA